MMKKNNLIINYDYYLFLAYLLLMIAGLIMQLNISSVRSNMSFFYRQLIWFVISFPVLWLAFYKINLDKIRNYIFPLVIFTIILLIIVLIFGENIKGSLRSIRIWHINIQPSILARIVLILYTAHILDKNQRYIDDESSPKKFLAHFSALIVIPIIILGLILAEKHFTPLVIASMTLISLLFLARINLKTIGVIILIASITIFLVLQFGPSYRSQRMDSYRKYSLFFKNNDSAEHTNQEAEYQIRESLISLASGKLFGTSPRKGTGKHYFLPEAKTDYVFAIIGEEYGFLGGLIIILCYCFLCYRGLKSSQQQNTLFLRLTGYGLSMNIFFNVIVNIGVAMSAFPSTGVTLPFISYG
ncbi:MAG: FtsW/RodA/SpoVE family cell cycle protein, partial [Candidatus Cloacimonetes bacterium]|nr:FtsW/RodA/SpoVE family cell cycle protein [Candidatus Cloacimonadota bacterium]